MGVDKNRLVVPAFCFSCHAQAVFLLASDYLLGIKEALEDRPASSEKEQGIVSKAEVRLLADLEKLKTRILKGRLKNPAKIHLQMGRLQERHPRVAK